MILVLKPHTSAKDNARVESLVKNKGLTPVSYTHLDVYKRQGTSGIRLQFTWNPVL